jgi:tetratricopeptide (TPR) repeat protein
VKVLLEDEVGTWPSSAALISKRPRTAAVPGKTPRWIAPAIAALAVTAALALWQPWKRTPTAVSPTTSPAVVAPKTPTPVSEARQLIAKAWVQLNKPEMGRAELEAAELLCKRAADLDPSDAEVWATWTHVHYWLIEHKFDFSPARRESERNCVDRAIRLDPASFEARLAQALREGPEKRLRELLTERPDDWRCAEALSHVLLRRPETRPEGIALLERFAQKPEHAALAWMWIGWFHWNRTKDYRQALEAAEKSVAVQPFWHNLGLKAQLAAVWLGDRDLALATAQQLKSAVRQEDWAVALFNNIYHVRREPKELLKFLNSIQREWISSNAFTGPKVALTGWAREADGDIELARRDYRRALDLIGKQLGADANNGRLLALKAVLLASCGDEAEARKIYELHRRLGLPRTFALWRFEPVDTQLDRLEANPPPAAELRLDPSYDPLRTHPRFAVILAKAEADPRKSPFAPNAAASAAASQPSPPPK